MDELQRVEFEMLKTLIQICDRFGLRYYLVCGSALGAVKYQGFIPWDDDLDVGLFREDYEKLLEKAPQYLPEHLFLQNSRTDPQFPLLYSKLRNSDTTFIEKSSRNLDINHGIYIDIFPLDGYPEQEKEAQKLERKKKIAQVKTACAFDMPQVTWKTGMVLKAERLLGLHKKAGRISQKLTETLAAYPTAGSRLICNHGNWQGKKEYAPKEQYGNGTFAVFEGLQVRIPVQYDAYLTQKYGDWRAELPEEEKQGHHLYVLCDPRNPYTRYIERPPNGRIRIKTPAEDGVLIE